MTGRAYDNEEMVHLLHREEGNAQLENVNISMADDLIRQCNI